MKYVLMVKIKVAGYAQIGKDHQERMALETMFRDWLVDPNLKQLRVFQGENIVEMKNDVDGFLQILWRNEELEFIAEGERSEATEKVWTYMEDPARSKAGILSLRASLIRDDHEVKLIYVDHGKSTVYDAAIYEQLADSYDHEMPVQLTKHHLQVSGINNAKVPEHAIRLLEELRQTTGGELTVNDASAQVTFESKFLMPAEKETLYQQLNLLGREVVQLDMEPLVLLAEDAFYYEVVQFESRKLKVYSMMI